MQWKYIVMVATKLDEKTQVMEAMARKEAGESLNKRPSQGQAQVFVFLDLDSSISASSHLVSCGSFF